MSPGKLGLQWPTAQVTAGGLGAVLIYLGIQVARYFWGFDPGTANDLVLEGLGTTLIAHLTPVSAVDIVKRINDDIALAGTFLGKLSSRSDSSAPMTTKAFQIAIDAK